MASGDNDDDDNDDICRTDRIRETPSVIIATTNDWLNEQAGIRVLTFNRCYLPNCVSDSLGKYFRNMFYKCQRVSVSSLYKSAIACCLLPNERAREWTNEWLVLPITSKCCKFPWNQMRISANIICNDRRNKFAIIVGPPIVVDEPPCQSVSQSVVTVIAWHETFNKC